MRMLVADDDPVYRTMLEDLLSEWGFPATVVADGSTAWDVLRGDDPDASASRPAAEPGDGGPPRVALLDWMMPGLDGFELCRKIRQEPSTRDAYVILLTGSRRKDEMIKVLVAGADDYLIKPFDPLDLRIRLRAARRILQLQKELAAARGEVAVP